MAALRRLKYLWFVIVMKATWVLPDWIPVMRFRGRLVRPCFARCGPNLQVASTAMVVSSSNIALGKNVYLAYGCWIQGIGGVTIEDDVMLGPYTVIASSNHSMANGSYRYGPPKREPVAIGRGSWTGAGTKILPGVSIGQGVLCAAGSVVSRSVPDFTVVGGVPAKVLAHADPLSGEWIRNSRERTPSEETEAERRLLNQ